MLIGGARKLRRPPLPTYPRYRNAPLLPSSVVGMPSDILPSPPPSEAGRRVTDSVENSGIDTASLFVDNVVHDPYGRHSAHGSRHWTHAHNEWIWLGRRVA